MKTVQDLAKDALFVANACNLTGVVHSFSRAMTDLRALYPNEGSRFFNEHPISIMYSQAISNITGSDSFTAYSQAYEACKKLTEPEPETV